MAFSDVAVNLARDQRFSRFAPPSIKVLRLAELGFFTAAVRWGQGLVPALGQTVREANRTHSDHKKFDEMLRMVLDCSREDMQAIEAGLQAMAAQGYPPQNRGVRRPIHDGSLARCSSLQPATRSWASL